MPRRFLECGQAAAISMTALAWSALAAAQPPPLPAAPPQQAQAAVLPSAMVRISPPDPHITLERRAGSLDLSTVPRSMYADLEPRWELVCISPCQALLPIMGEYRIAGQDITPSSTFSLRAPALDLKVATGSASARTAGIYLAIFGFLVGVAGGVLATSVAVSNSNAMDKAPRPLLITGAVGAGVGGGVGIVGLGLALASGTNVNDVNGGNLPDYVGPVGLLQANGRF